MVKENKSNRYLNLLLTIANSPGWSLTEDRLKEVLGRPSKSQFYLYINELTNDVGERPALLERFKEEEIIRYKLNSKTWKSFYEASEEGAFMLEAHRKLGHLLGASFSQDHLDLYELPRHIERKFIFLSKIQAKERSASDSKVLQLIIKSVVGSNKVIIRYDDKTYNLFPTSICQYRDDLYLLAFKDKISEENLRTFKICRIQKVMESSESFIYPSLSRYNPNDIYKKTSGLIRGKTTEAKIRFYGHAKKIMTERNFFSSKLENSTPHYDEYLCTYTSINEFLGQLFTYADEMQIIGPKELVDSFNKKLETALHLNSTKKRAA